MCHGRSFLSNAAGLNPAPPSVGRAVEAAAAVLADGRVLQARPQRLLRGRTGPDRSVPPAFCPPPAGGERGGGTHDVLHRVPEPGVVTAVAPGGLSVADRRRRPSCAATHSTTSPCTSTGGTSAIISIGPLPPCATVPPQGQVPAAKGKRVGGGRGGGGGSAPKATCPCAWSARPRFPAHWSPGGRSRTCTPPRSPRGVGRPRPPAPASRWAAAGAGRPGRAPARRPAKGPAPPGRATAPLCGPGARRPTRRPELHEERGTQPTPDKFCPNPKPNTRAF